MPPIVWTIAGFDPSSGAGVTADLKTIAAHSCYGASAITALTIQNTLGVRRVESVTAAGLRETLQVLLEDLPPNAIKIGMLYRKDIIQSVATFLTEVRGRCPLVLDPILLSSSGAPLLESEAVELLRSSLLPLVTVLTPNRAEAAELTGLPVEDAESLAVALRRMGPEAVVVTGGDPLGDASCADLACDTLAYRLGGLESVETLSAPRLASTSTHGTGCAFSTSIACGLALGLPIPQAVTRAKAYVRRAMELAPQGIGSGRGPLGLLEAANMAAVE